MQNKFLKNLTATTVFYIWSIADVANIFMLAGLSRIYIAVDNWFGTFMGRIANNRWTCIGAALELYKSIGVKTNFYGTGLLGFGTTLFDPILPVRFLADPALELITTSEQSPTGVSSAKETE